MVITLDWSHFIGYLNGDLPTEYINEGSVGSIFRQGDTVAVSNTKKSYQFRDGEYNDETQSYWHPMGVGPLILGEGEYGGGAISIETNYLQT